MEKKPIISSDMLIEQAVAIANDGRKKTVVVAVAQDVDVIEAIVEAQKTGYLNGVLVGDKSKIESLAGEKNIDLKEMNIVDEPDVLIAANKAVELASTKEADAIMKGFVPTSALLKTILKKEYNLRGKETLSHCAVLDIPGYHKLLNLTDGGMVVKPTKEQKLGILENAITVSKALNLTPVRIAVSGATNLNSSKISHIKDDVEFLIPKAKEMFPDVEIKAPLPFDLATSKKAAKHRNLDDAVSGDADVYLVDSIEECNLVAKSLIQFAQAVFAGVIVGAKVPVSLVSRTDTVKNKKTSLAIACLMADYYDQNNFWEN
ncbi:MAG: phosphate acyltransferase [candidate division Zixibacteria bacterium]|nr:phosphate acyltransferase [candidate division Zixibacteria bacterium]